MKTLVTSTLVLTLIMFVGGCSKGSKNTAPRVEKSGVSLSSKTVYIRSSKANYSSRSRIAQNIKDECKLDTQIITFIQSSAKSNGMSVEITNNIPSNGIELNIEITDAISSGNAFIGHRKFASIAGSLTQGGQSVGSFEAARRTGGGMFGGFKGSCAVLGRSIKALANDTVKWMKKPSNNAQLGDVRLIPHN